MDAPVAVFTTDIEKDPVTGDDPKDIPLVFKKKLILALFALGQTFVEHMIVVRHSKEVKLGKKYEDLGDPDDRLRESVRRFEEQADAFPGATVEFLVMAPGHGNLEKL